MAVEAVRSADLRRRLAGRASLILVSILLAWVSSLFFPLRLEWRLFLSAMSGIAFYWLLHRVLLLQTATRVEHHYLEFLAFLSSRLSVGETLDKACLSYVQEQSRLNMARSDPSYWHSLERLARQISLQGNLSQSLESLLDTFPSPHMRPVLLALPKLGEMGGRLDRFVRDSHQSLLEFLTLEREVRSENSQKIAEAWILAGMPFVLASGSLLLVPLQERALLLSDPRSQAIYALAYLFTCLALVLTGLISRNHPTQGVQPKPRQPARRSSPLILQRWGQILAASYQSSLLKGITQPVFLALGQIPDRTASHFQVKIWLSLSSVLLALIWVLSGSASALIILATPLAVSVAQDLLLIRRVHRLANQYRLIYPLFLTWLVNGLLSGFSVTRVLHEAGELWRSSDPANVLSQDLAFFRQQSEGGRPTYWISEQLAHRCLVPEIQSFWHGLARYEREGSSELLNLLVLMAAGSRQLLRTGRRQELEEKSLRLLFPMMIDLLAVLVLAGWPSLSLMIL